MIKTNVDLLTYLNQVLVTDQQHKGAIQRRTFSKGQFLLEQGDQPQHVYFLVRGMVKCFITEQNGRSYVLEFLGEGEMLGEMESLIDSDNLCTVEAIADVEAYQVSQTFFINSLLPEPAFNRLLLQELALRLTRTAQRASYQQLFPMEYAVLKVLYLFGKSNSPVSKQDIADYLAVPVRSLNRVLNHLNEQKLFTISTKGDLTVSQEKLLERIQIYQ